MKKTYFSENLATIRSVWKLKQSELGALLGADMYKLGNLERGKTKEVPADLLLKLEELTGIQAKRIYYEYLKPELIHYKPLEIIEDDDTETAIPMMSEDPAPYEKKMTVLERLARIESTLYGE